MATAECATRWVTDPHDLQIAWDRFLHGPEPVGYDPAIIPSWTSAESESFGVVELAPHRLRVFPGSLLLEGKGELLTWTS